jgi:hypothetical protein
MSPKKKTVADESAEAAGDGVSTDSCTSILSRTNVSMGISLDTRKRASSKSPVQPALI